MSDIRRRFWIELGLAVSSGVVLVLMLIRADWIESLVGFNPDDRDGSLERALPVIMLVATVTFSVVARLEWVHAGHAARRARQRRRHTDWSGANDRG
jgi:hypothetical protein